LRFFWDHGAGAAFWASNWVSATVLSADVGAIDTTVSVSDTGAIQAGDWLGFAPVPGVAIAGGARILGIAGAGPYVLTLDEALGSAMPADRTLVSHLLLCRWQEPRLEIAWFNPDFAQMRLPLRELSQEYNIAGDETLAVTQGLLPTRVYLYEFSRVLNGATFYERYTSFEQDLTLGPVWSAAKISHADIKQGLSLERDEVDVVADVIPGSVMVLLATMQSEATVTLKITQGDTVDGVNVINSAVIFTGEVVSAAVTGSRITCKVVPGGSLYDRLVPRFYFQRHCNHALFSPGCGLVKADWKFTATISDPGSVGYPFTFALAGLARVSGPGPTYFADWFAGGWMELGAGANWQRRAILLSSMPVAGAMTVTLDRDPRPFPGIGDAVVLYPGCDLTKEMCSAYDAVNNPGGKFDNYLNFGGHPYIPIANPIIIAASAGNSKK
jgi:hypothetical protein